MRNWTSRAAVFSFLVASSAAFADDGCDYDKIVGNFDPATKTSDLIIRAVQGNCSDLMDTLLKKETESDIFKATPLVSATFMSETLAGLETLKTAYVGEPGTDEVVQAFQKKVKIINKFFDFSKQKCPDEKQSTPACNARKLNTSTAATMKDMADRAMAEEKAKQVAAQNQPKRIDPEKVFKMKFCKSPNLLAVAFYDQVPIERGCIYSLAPQGYVLTVTQSVPGGIIIGAQNGPTNGKSIFIKTKREYADGDMVQPQFVRSDGLKKFTTVLGAQRTINAFQYLGDGAHVDDDSQ